jgi:PIN domain nuclease of toxin-antitoxin system
MRLLLDTVTLLFAIEASHRISPKAKSALANQSNIREISVVSLAEIALKNAIGKLALSKNELVEAMNELQVRILPCTANHALQLFNLPLHHRDPFDRQIIAQALAENIPVVTCDEQFCLYEQLNVIW